MATLSSILAWRIPWTEKPGGLQSMGSQGVGHLSDLAHISGRGRAVGSGGSGHLGGAVDSPGRGDGSLGRVPGGPFPRMNPV